MDASTSTGPAVHVGPREEPRLERAVVAGGGRLAPLADAEAIDAPMDVKGEPEPLLCGLAGGAQHGPDGGPGDVVLAGAKDG